MYVFKLIGLLLAMMVSKKKLKLSENNLIQERKLSKIICRVFEKGLP